MDHGEPLPGCQPHVAHFDTASACSSPSMLYQDEEEVSKKEGNIPLEVGIVPL
jgi:hypothetical protein